VVKDSIKRLFSNDHFWKWSWIVFGLIAILKGLRLPSRWGATEAVIDYSDGFIKRGLFGATLGHWLNLNVYSNFALVASLLFGIVVALLATAIVSSNILNSTVGQIATSVFAASFGLTYLAHIVGYPRQV
jgi:hypothetical protein